MNKLLSGLIILIIAFSCKEKIPNPTAEFSYKLNKGEVSFSNQSTNANTYEWDFGDGKGQSKEKDPKYNYLNPGKYNVTLKSIGLGGEVQIQKNIDVIAIKPVSAFSFTYLENGGVQLVNESKDAESFEWEIEGLGKLTIKEPKIIFSYNGQYKIKLKAIGFGEFAESEQLIKISNGKDHAPILAFSAQDLGVGKYRFTNKTQYGENYNWDFGDGLGKSNLENPEYTYQENGLYKIKLTAIGKGGTDSKDSLIKVTSSFDYYSYTIENKSAYTITVYNNDASKPLQNFADVTLLPNTKIIVKTRASTGLVPMLKSSDSNLFLEYTTTDNKTYTLNAYLIYSYTLENKSAYTITVYNNDASKPLQNFADVTLLPNTKTIVKIRAGTGLVPMLKSSDPNLFLEYSTTDNKTYTLNAYLIYSYTIENKSAYAITVYNNDASKPLQNFADVTLLPNTKTIVKTRASTGLVPMLKSSDPNLFLEYSTTDNKTYTLNAYYYTYEIKFTGTSEPITVITNIKGQKETLTSIKLPSSLNTKLSNIDILEVQALKNNVSGIVNVQIYFKNILIRVETITDPFANVQIKYNTVTKQFDVTKYSPEEWVCGTFNGHTLKTGPRGGCYYINSNGNKTYVDRDFCNCN